MYVIGLPAHKDIEWHMVAVCIANNSINWSPYTNKELEGFDPIAQGRSLLVNLNDCFQEEATLR